MLDRELDLIEHLEEMRKRLIIIGLNFLFFFFVAFIFVKDIYQFFILDLDYKLIILSPTDTLWIYFMLAAVPAITCSIPVILMQIWLFVKPALSEQERKITLAYIPAIFGLFLAGISFGYFVVFPIVLQFLMTLSEDLFAMNFTTMNYFRFMLHMTLPFGLLFEMPILILFLTALGIINPYRLKKVRKYAYFVLVIISVMITPPDFISDILVIIPLLLLYEFSIYLSQWVFRKKLNETMEMNLP